MWDRIYLFMITSFITVFITACAVTALSEKDEDREKIDISIDRIDNSIIGDNGQVVAEIYYDKAVASGDSDISKAINSFFDKESEGWLGGTNRLTHFQEGWLNNFLIEVEEMRKSMSDKEISEQAFLYTIDTKVMMLSDTMLSIMQIATIQTGGSRSWYYFGSTFDLKTGKLLPIDAIIKTDADSLRDMLVAFLQEKGDSLNSSATLEEIKNIYGEQDDHSYEVNYGQEEIQLNYEYFYDGEYFYIILNHGVFHDSGCIMKWNGLYDDDFEASLIGYLIEKNKIISEIGY